MHGFSLAKHRTRRSAPTSGDAWFHSLSVAAGSLIYNLTCHIMSHPYPLRGLFALLRGVRPITVLGKLVVVSQHADVREALARFDDFHLADILGPKMPWGPALLSLDWREQHNRERHLLESMVMVDDVRRIRSSVAATCGDLLAKKYAVGEIDVVSDLCNDVVIDVIHSTFGVPLLGDSQEMTRILGDVAGFILVAPPVHSERSKRAYASMALLTEKVLERIKSSMQALRRAPGEPTQADDLLARLVKLRCGGQGPGWLDDDWIRRYVTGLAATGGGTMVRATTQAMDQLIARPAALEEARKLAQKPDGDANAWDGLHQIVYEALRFRPMLPLLVRHIPRDTIIAKGTGRARMVPAGGTIIAGPIAAMFDPHVFKKPSRFSSNRSVDHYVHFGFGPRLCFGKYVADVVMVEIIRSLLLLPNLRRAPGRKGRVSYDGPVVTSLHLRFDPGKAELASATASATEE
jgi:cytochrome P450